MSASVDTLPEEKLEEIAAGLRVPEPQRRVNDSESRCFRSYRVSNKNMQKQPVADWSTAKRLRKMEMNKKKAKCVRSPFHA